jgi:hypothetical protein
MKGKQRTNNLSLLSQPFSAFPSLAPRKAQPIPSLAPYK